MRSVRKPFLITVAMASVLALGACSSQGGARNDPTAGDQAFTIAIVTHEQAGDTFWDKVRAGAEDAAAQHDIEIRYSNNEQGPQQATLVQNAIDSQVDGLAVTLSSADAVVPVARRAADAGIPVVAFNQGIDQYRDAGAMMYFGSDENLAGQAVGRRLAEVGPGGKVLCVVQAQGSVALEARCDGVREAYPNTENIQVIGTDLPSVQQTLNAKFAEDPTITDVVTLAAPVGMAALQAQQGTGSTAQIATFDLDQDAAAAIQDGRILLSVDQQPYVQGYMAVQGLWLNLTNGNDIGGGRPTLTGPSIVDASNIDEILPYTQANRR